MPEDANREPHTKPTVWLVNHYGGREGSVRSERTWRVARSLAKGGFRCLLISASFHHIQTQSVEEKEIEVLIPENGGYESFAVATRSYSGNGLDRLRNMFEFYRGLVRRFRDGTLPKPDLVIASSPHPFVFLFAILAKKKAGSVAVLEERDIWPRSLVELTGASAFHPVVLLFRWMAGRGYRGCDALVSLLPDSESFLRQRGLRGDFIYIPNGVGEIQSDEGNEVVPRDVDTWFESASTDGKMTVVYAGAMGPPNALEQLLNLSGEKEEKNYRILCFGDGVSREELTDLAAEKAGDFLTFRGPVPRSVARKIIDRADVCLISLRPSPLFEMGVSPNKLFEYMAAGKPVLFSVNSSNNPVAVSGCGISVPPYDIAALEAALESLANMSDREREAMGSRGKAYVSENHHWDQLGEKYASVCRNLLSGQAGENES